MKTTNGKNRMPADKASIKGGSIPEERVAAAPAPSHPEPLTVRFVDQIAPEDMTPAEGLEAKFHAALTMLDQVAARIERSGPNYVVWRGRTFRREEALESVSKAFETLGHVETYLSQHAENERRTAAA
jgi:hypothetical protein